MNELNDWMNFLFL